MQAALTAAERGHDVTLFEKQPRLGGQIRWFTRTQVRAELGGIIEFLTVRLQSARVDIRLGAAAQVGDLADFDTVVLATGSIPLRHGWSALRPERWNGPSLPGMDGPDIFTIEDVLGPNEKKLKHDVLVYDTLGGRQAVVVADHLATNGHSVHFATPLGQVSPNLAATRDWGKVYGKLRRQGVTFACDVELKSVAGSIAVFRDVYTNADVPRTFGSLVQVVGSAANDGLMRELKGKTPHAQLYMVGDCLAPRRVSDAIREGELIARAI
jgi:phytoene dehydrogenase-like protein